VRERFFTPAAALAALCASVLSCRGPSSPAVLSVVQSSDVLTLDPNEKFEVVTDTVAMNLFDSLLRYDAHMNLEPCLAERWETPTERSWRFHLRRGVRFHDGEPLTADDVAFTLHRALGRPDSEIYPFLSGIEEVRALGPETVEIVTRQPMTLLVRLSFVYILPAKRLQREGEEEFFRHPVGTGPYRFVSRKTGDRIVLDAFPGYWGGRPAVGRAEFRAIPRPEDQWQAAETTHPTVLLSAPRKGWAEHRKDTRLLLIERPSLTVSYLGLNMTPRPGNPLADLHVRQAIRLAIDPRELVRRGAESHGFPASQYVPPDVIGYNPALSVPAPDPAAARRLLAEAGHPEGLDLVLDYQANGRSPMVDEIISQLALVGIRVVPRSWPKDVFFDRIDAGQSDFHVSGWVCSSGESSELFETSFHTRVPGGLGRSNGVGYSNPEVDRLTEQIISTIDPAARVELEKEAMAVAVHDLPWIPLYIQEDRYALTPDVRWEPRADGEILLPEVRLK
jgi:peptide/nickel transport system substrate-binding protein